MKRHRRKSTPDHYVPVYFELGPLRTVKVVDGELRGFTDGEADETSLDLFRSLFGDWEPGLTDA